MEEKINTILDMLIAGGNAAKEQLPGLMDEYILYYTIQSLPLVSVSGVMVLLSALCFLWYKHLKKAEWIGSEDITAASVLGGVLIVYFSIYAVDSFRDIVKLQYAPKAFLIEHMRK